MGFVITETPSEAAAIVAQAVRDEQVFAELTLGNTSAWNAKPLYVNPTAVFAISPPKDMAEE